MKYAKITLFTLIFGVMLAALIAICIWAFSGTSSADTTPRLSFRPMPINKEDGTLIWLRGVDQKNVQMWVDNISQFLSNYYTPSKIDKGNARIKRCSYSNYPGPGESCEVNLRDWGECNRYSNFNYHRRGPCIFLMLNKIYGWTPEFYDNPNDLPQYMPENLKQHIKAINNTRERQTVWVSCEGENPADIEFIGPVTYHPQIQGFPGYYFPYTNTEGYLSPLVAVKLERPVTGVVINIECKVWAKNIPHNRANGTGSVHFELLID